jgi:hypothetical protein
MFLVIYFSHDKIKENEMAASCSTHSKRLRSILSFVSKTRNGRGRFQDMAVNKSIILKCILHTCKWNSVVGIACMWLKTTICGGQL